VFASHIQYICFSLLISSQGNSWPVFVPLRSAGDFEYKKQRWVSLQRFYSKYQSKYFYPKDAIAVYLKHSLVPFVWKKPQVFITRHFLSKLLFVSTYNHFFLSFSSLIFYQKLSS